MHDGESFRNGSIVRLLGGDIQVAVFVEEGPLAPRHALHVGRRRRVDVVEFCTALGRRI